MTQQPTPDACWTDPDRMTGAMARAGLDGMAETGAAGHRSVLARAFADEVLPRLLQARRTTAPVAAQARRAVTQAEIEQLLAAVLTGTGHEALAYAEMLHAGGLSTEAILLDLLTPVARALGRMWEDDTCTFSDVTLGLGRLAHIMRTVCDPSEAAAPLHAAPAALLVQMPGEQHGFGLSMVTHFFRQGGWRVRQAPAVTSAGLIGLVRTEWFAIVGISVSCSDRLDALASDIGAIRKHSRNTGIGVMVGGPPFLAHPQLAAMVGADATAMDAQQALQEAQRLAGTRARGQ